MGDIQLQIDLTNIVLALVAIVGLLAAWRQLRTMQVDSKTQIGIAKLQELATRASVLLNLDERFGTPAMLEARNEMGALIARVDERMEQERGYLAARERKKTGSEYYAEELEKMRREPRAESYGRLMVALSFFETVGYVTSSEYIPLKDVLKLFGPTVKEAGIVFEEHINKLREVYGDEALYDNFLWLIKESKKV